MSNGNGGGVEIGAPKVPPAGGHTRKGGGCDYRACQINRRMSDLTRRKREAIRNLATTLEQWTALGLLRYGMDRVHQACDDATKGREELFDIAEAEVTKAERVLDRIEAELATPEAVALSREREAFMDTQHAEADTIRRRFDRAVASGRLTDEQRFALDELGYELEAWGGTAAGAIPGLRAVGDREGAGAEPPARQAPVRLRVLSR